jgi:hypothetical protein
MQTNTVRPRLGRRSTAINTCWIDGVRAAQEFSKQRCLANPAGAVEQPNTWHALTHLVWLRAKNASTVCRPTKMASIRLGTRIDMGASSLWHFHLDAISAGP